MNSNAKCEMWNAKWANPVSVSTSVHFASRISHFDFIR
jgi:hypothetical protein